MKYYVSYSVMDGEAGANPLGHASLILSKQEDKAKDVVVQNCFGYYSQPSTTTNVFIKVLKKIINLDADLQNGHGELRQEEMRHININGLSGISFEATEEQFKNLEKECLDRIKTEQELIKSLNEELIKLGIKPNGQTRFKLAKEKAKLAQVESFLKPFHLEINSNNKPLDTTASFTCKSMAIDLLFKHKIISEEIKKQLLDSKNAAFPRFSSIQLRPIRLVSTGPRTVYKSKRAAKTHYNHYWDKNPIYFATPMYTVTNKSEYKAEDARRTELLKKVLTQISSTELKLYKLIEQKGNLKKNALDLSVLKHQLNEVQNLSLLFINSTKNQDPKIFAKHLDQANKSLSLANNVILEQTINLPFMLKAFTSPDLKQNPLLGLLLMACSIPAFFFLPPLGASLLASGALLAGAQYYSFYKAKQEDKKIETLVYMHAPQM